MNERCRLCDSVSKDAAAPLVGGVCAQCRSAPGFWQLPPWNRPVRACVCGSDQYVRALAQERAALHLQYATPLAVSFKRKTSRTFFDATELETSTVGVGWLEMLICRSCGHVQWFAINPGDLPIGPEYGTELVEVPAGEAPYR